MTVIIMVMIIVIMVVMIIVVVVIMAFVVIMVVMIIVVVVIMAFVVIMIGVIVVIVVIIVIVMIIVVIMDMHFSVKVFSFSPNQRRSNSSLDREGATIAEAPLKNATKKTINGVMPWVIFEVVVKTTMALDGKDGREVEFTGFKSLSTTMGAVGLGRRNGSKRAQQKSQQGKA